MKIDLEEECDPPSYTAGQRKLRMKQVSPHARQPPGLTISTQGPGGILQSDTAHPCGGAAGVHADERVGRGVHMEVLVWGAQGFFPDCPSGRLVWGLGKCCLSRAQSLSQRTPGHRCTTPPGP